MKRHDYKVILRQAAAFCRGQIDGPSGKPVRMLSMCDQKLVLDYATPKRRKPIMPVLRRYAIGTTKTATACLLVLCVELAISGAIRIASHVLNTVLSGS